MTRPSLLLFLSGFPLGALAGFGFYALANQMFYAFAAFLVVFSLQCFVAVLCVFIVSRGIPGSVVGRYTGFRKGSS